MLKLMSGLLKYRLGHSRAWLFFSVLVLGLTFLRFDATTISSTTAILQDTQSPPGLYKTALQALQKKDYPIAEKLLRQLVALDSRYQEPSGRSAWYQLGMALARQEKSLEAIQAMQQGFDSLKARTKNDWYLNYELARLCAENLSSGNEVTITELVYEVFKNSTPALQPDLWQQLFDEIAFMLDKPERAQFKKAVSEKNGEAGQVLLRFFRREDAFPATPANESLLVFFERAAVARAQFAYGQSPRSFDERGDIYVRLGEPWRIFTDHSGMMGDVGWALYPYEVWFYNTLHADLYYTFTRKEGQVQYTLVDGPESIYGPFYRSRSTFFNRDTRPVPRGGRITLGRNTQLNQPNAGETAMKLRDQVYRNLAPSHDDFRRRLYEISNTRSEVEALDYSLLHFTNEDRKHAAHIDSIAPAVVFSEDYKAKSLPVVLSFSRFRGEAGKTRAEIYFGGLYRDLHFKKTKQGQQARLRGNIVIRNHEYEVVAGESFAENCWLPISAATDSGDFVSQINFTLPPANYHLLFRAENQDDDQIGTLEYTLEVAAFPEKTLSLSDLQLSAAIREAGASHRFVKNGYQIVPLPGLTVEKNRPLFIYFEIYNLTQNSAGETNYQLDYRVFVPKSKKGLFGKVGGLFGGEGDKHSITLSTNRQGKLADQVEHVELDLEKFESNNLELEITVTDLLAKEKVSSKLPFKIVDSPKKKESWKE
jgi:GWxTD domain-containing protein